MTFTYSRNWSQHPEVVKLTRFFCVQHGCTLSYKLIYHGKEMAPFTGSWWAASVGETGRSENKGVECVNSSGRQSSVLFLSVEQLKRNKIIGHRATSEQGSAKVQNTSCSDQFRHNSVMCHIILFEYLQWMCTNWMKYNKGKPTLKSKSFASYWIATSKSYFVLSKL